MADVTKSIMTRNNGATITTNNGAASQTVVCNRGDEKVLIRVSNSDATTALIRIKANGFGAGKQGDLDVQVAQNAVRGFVLESSRFKDPATQKLTIEVLGVGGGAFGGTVTNVKIEIIEMPKGLID